MPKNSSKDFRKILSDELAKRSKKNPLYSMRSFARDLGLSPPRLSSILNKKYSLSPNAAQEVAEKLGLITSARDEFVKSVVLDKVSRRSVKPKLKEIPMYEHLSKETFLLISEWYHFAILELTYLKSFQPTSEWIAHRLGISLQEASGAVERLRKLNLLQILRTGKFRPTSKWTLSPTDIPNQAIRSAHTQLLNKAIRSLQRDKLEDRHFTNCLIAINKSDLPEMKREIEKFSNFIVSKFGNGKNKDAVYSIAIQLFSVETLDT
jgi:uncharacterized protein (TIGR02147 family)